MRMVIGGLCGLGLLTGCGTPQCPTKLDLLAPYVGQGHGLALVQGRQALVFDAGPPEQSGLRRALQNAGVDTITALFLTHPDLDHWGGLDSLLGYLPLKTLIHGPVDSARRKSTFGWACSHALDGCDTLWRGQSRVFWRGLWVQCLWPDSGALFPDPNTGSLVLRVSQGGRGLLLVSGDLDTLGELAVTSELEPVEAMELGHHGSRTSAHLLFLGKASPKWVVVQAGIQNDYGHPSAEALQRARAVGAVILQPTPNKNVRLEYEPDACEAR